MPFPLEVAGLTLNTAGSLGFAVAFDLAHGGSQVFLDVGPEAWIPLLVAEGRLDAEELRSLVRALLAEPDARALALAVALCDRLAPEGVGPWLVAALVQHDLGTLLTLVDGHTVEGLLARSAARHADLADAGWREAVLGSLRNAGALVDEAQVLARWGTPDELEIYGPVLVASEDPDVRAALEVALDGPAGDVVDRLLWEAGE